MSTRVIYALFVQLGRSNLVSHGVRDGYEGDMVVETNYYTSLNI